MLACTLAQLPLFSYAAQSPANELVPPDFRVVFPISVNPVKSPLGQGQVCPRPT